MKNICFFISSISQGGGTERVCTEIANKLNQAGYKVTVLTMYGGTPFFKLNDGVSLETAFNKKQNIKLILPIALLKLRRKVKSINPDYLVNADSALFVYSWVALAGLGIKNIVWEHFNFNVTLGARIRVLSRRLAAKYSDAIITLTNRDRYIWQTKLDCEVPVYTIHNPTPFNNSTFNVVKKPIVLSIGRLTFQKGFDRLIDTWEMIKKARNTDWELHIVGSGELHTDLKQQIKDLNLESSIKLIPVTPNIQQHYQQAGIYCLPSRFEGFGMVLIEAQSFGIPVVSFDCDAGPSEIIKDDSGILVENGDKKAMANALTYLMENEEARVKMGARSFENSFRYSIDIVIKRWLRLFEVDLK